MPSAQQLILGLFGVIFAKRLRLFFGGAMEALKSANDVLFILLGAIMVLAMHAGFAFLRSARCEKEPGQRPG